MADFVTIKKVAEHLDMSERTVQRMVAAGSLTGYADRSEI
jgi:excisionase family DNA binding protein